MLHENYECGLIKCTSAQLFRIKDQTYLKKQIKKKCSTTSETAYITEF